MAVVTEMSVKNLGLTGFKNGWIDSFHPWVVDSIQLECARSESDTAMMAELQHCQILTVEVT